MPKKKSAELIAQAKAASANSYAPYSHFPVGAVVEDQRGRVFSGCNVENGVFGLTQCAERNALNNAVAHGAKAGTLERLVIYVPGERAFAPCGACRQVMHELMAPEAVIISACDSSAVKEWSKKGLLPDAFDFPKPGVVR